MTPRKTVGVTFLRYAGGLLLLSFLSALGLAQTPMSGSGDPFNSLGTGSNGISRSMERRGDQQILRVAVLGEDGKTPLDRQSVVKLTHQGSHLVNWATTDETSVASLGLPYGLYDVEVSAVGYLPVQRQIQISQLNITSAVFSLHRDPTAENLDVMVTAMPPKARKETKHAVTELKSGKLKSAQKELDAAYKLAPSSPDLNYLLGYLNYQQHDLAQAQSYLKTASKLDSHHLQALTLLGRIELTERQYPEAAATLEKAIEGDPNSWFAHDLLADAYLRERKYPEAQKEAELAIESGKIRSNPAHLILGEALVNAGKKEEGIKELKTFVQDSPKNPVAPGVQDVIAKLEAGTINSMMVNTNLDSLAGSKNEPLPAAVDPLLAFPEMPVFVRSWQPLGIDDIKPLVAKGVSCPLENVIENSGDRMKELVNDVSRMAAIEHLVHERMDEMGNPASKETRDYNYEVSISEKQPGYLAVDEDRYERLTRAQYPDELYSGGFAALALVFHPVLRDNFEMACEGLGDWHGQAAWLVHFRQRNDRPARIHDYKVGDNVYSLRLKGRAWITADKFQIVRIESQLINPVPEIRLRSEQIMVEYGPVQFPKRKEELWLPKTAEFYLDFRKHLYYRRHSFDHYMLFSVDTEEKRNEQKLQSNQPKDAPN